MFLERNNRRLKRIALVWLNDLNVDFTHGKYNAAPAQPWAGNKAGGDPVHDANNRQAPIMQLPSSWDSAWASWPTRGAGRASAEGTQRQVPRCGNVDQRYEFLLRTTSPTWTSTTRAVPTYTPARGHSASCSMRRSSPKVRAIKRVRALFPRAMDIGWYLMDGAWYTISWRSSTPLTTRITLSGRSTSTASTLPPRPCTPTLTRRSTCPGLSTNLQSCLTALNVAMIVVIA